MSEKVETRTLPKRVKVYTCDGPECVKEATSQDEYDNGHVLRNEGWFLVQQYQIYSYQTADPGPWHFHSLKCLTRWARVRLGVPVVLQDTTG